MGEWGKGIADLGEGMVPRIMVEKSEADTRPTRTDCVLVPFMTTALRPAIRIIL
jgi:hypothetical protein